MLYCRSAYYFMIFFADLFDVFVWLCNSNIQAVIVCCLSHVVCCPLRNYVKPRTWTGERVVGKRPNMLTRILFLLTCFGRLTSSSAAASCPAPPPKYVFAPNSCVDNDGCSADHCDCGYPRLEKVSFCLHVLVLLVFVSWSFENNYWKRRLLKKKAYWTRPRFLFFEHRPALIR